MGVLFETTMKIMILRELSNEKVFCKWLMSASTRWQNNFVKESRSDAGLTAAGTLCKQRDGGDTCYRIFYLFFKVHHNIFLVRSPQSGVICEYIC